MALSCHCGSEETGRHRSDCGYYEPQCQAREIDIERNKIGYCQLNEGHKCSHFYHYIRMNKERCI